MYHIVQEIGFSDYIVVHWDWMPGKTTKFHDINTPPLHPANDNTLSYDKRVI